MFISFFQRRELARKDAYRSLLIARRKRVDIYFSPEIWNQEIVEAYKNKLVAKYPPSGTLHHKYVSQPSKWEEEDDF